MECSCPCGAMDIIPPKETALDAVAKPSLFIATACWSCEFKDMQLNVGQPLTQSHQSETAV